MKEIKIEKKCLFILGKAINNKLRKKKNISLNLKVSWFVFILLLIGCKGFHLDITLPKEKHLQETIAGAWIKVFGLTYDDNSRYITERIHDILMRTYQGQLIDTYSEGKESETLVYELPSAFYPFNEDYKVVIYETIIFEQEHMSVGITLKLTLPGIPWSILLPDHCELLKPNRKLEHAATILSRADNGARLFLFGLGNYCTEIELF